MKNLIPYFFILIANTLAGQYSIEIQSGVNINSNSETDRIPPRESLINSIRVDYRVNKFSKIAMKLAFTQNRNGYHYLYTSSFPTSQNSFSNLLSHKETYFDVHSNYSRLSLNYLVNSSLTEKTYLQMNGGFGFGHLYSINVSAQEKKPSNGEIREEIYFIKGETDRDRIELFLEGGLSVVHPLSEKFDISLNSNFLYSLSDLNENQVPVINNAYTYHTTSDANRYRTINLSFTLGLAYKFKNQKDEK